MTTAGLRDLAPELSALTRLCPSGVVVRLSGDCEEPAFLFPDEEAAVAGALEKRRREFALGRGCARRALRQLGVAPCSIPARADRAPVWPSGIVGAITHTRGLIAAAVVRESDVAGFGLDVESREHTLRESLDRFIRTPAERARQASLPGNVDPLRLVFSAKEAVHKCIAPTSGITLGFHDVELDVDAATSTFRVRLVGARDSRLPNFQKLIGRFAVTEAFVITTVTLPAVLRPRYNPSPPALARTC